MAVSRILVDKWYSGILPQMWERAIDILQSRLDNLARILGVIHAAVEHPAPSVIPTRVVCTANTTINSGAQTDITGATTTYTPTVAGTLVVFASWLTDCATFGAATDRPNHHLTVDGVASSIVAAPIFSVVGQRTASAMVFYVPVVAGKTYTLKLTSRQAAGVSTYTVVASQTSGFYLALFPNLYTP